MLIIDYFLEYNRYLNIFGIFLILLVAFLFSKNRSKIDYRLVITALFLQFAIAIFVLKSWLGSAIVNYIAQIVAQVYNFSEAGINFVFGDLAQFKTFAVNVLPIIIFFGALMALLFHFGIIQKVIWLINLLIRPILGTSGAETLCAISNSFLGQTEAPLVVRKYLSKMTKSEMFVVMVSGMGTISGSLLAVFAKMGVPATHLLAASVMAIPGSILISKIILPETDTPETLNQNKLETEKNADNFLGAIADGTTDGLKLAVNVAAMLISFLALMAMLDYLLSFSSIKINSLLSWVNINYQLPVFTINYIFSVLFSPFAYFLGFSGEEKFYVGQLLGTKVVLNEFIAYCQMGKMVLSDRTVAIVTYALCGFSNFSCIGIQIGGIGALVPEKRSWLIELGFYAVLGGTLSNLLSAMIAALLI